MKNLHQYLLCLGSNYQAKIHIPQAQNMLKAHTEKSIWSDVLITAPEDTSHSTPYHNCAAIIYTERELEEMQVFLKELERRSGRTPEGKKLGIIPLDIDILAYDHHTIRPDDFKKKFIQETLNSLRKKEEATTLYIPT